MELEQQIQELIDCLKTGLLEFKSTRSHLSWRAISKHSGVNRYFIKKIIEDDGVADSSKTIEMGQAMILLEFVSDRTSLGAVWKSCPNYMKPLWKEAVRASQESVAGLQQGFQNDAALWETLPADTESLLITVFACFSNGLARTQLGACFGQGTDEKIDRLIESKIVEECEDGQIKILNNDQERPFLMANETALKVIPQLIQRFMTGAGSREQISFGAENVSEKSLEQLAIMQEEFQARILTFVRDCERGEHPAFVFSGVGSLAGSQLFPARETD